MSEMKSLPTDVGSIAAIEARRQEIQQQLLASTDTDTSFRLAGMLGVLSEEEDWIRRQGGEHTETTAATGWWGVRIKEPGKPSRWYTDNRHTQAEALALARHYTENQVKQDRMFEDRNDRAFHHGAVYYAAPIEENY